MFARRLSTELVDGSRFISFRQPISGAFIPKKRKISAVKKLSTMGSAGLSKLAVSISNIGGSQDQECSQSQCENELDTNENEGLTKRQLNDINLEKPEVMERFVASALQSISRSLTSSKLKPTLREKLQTFQTAVTVKKENNNIVGLFACPFCDEQRKIHYQGKTDNGKGWNYSNFIAHINLHENHELINIEMEKS